IKVLLSVLFIPVVISCSTAPERKGVNTQIKGDTVKKDKKIKYDVKKKIKLSISPLHVAVKSGKVKAVIKLIRKGNDVNAKDINLNTPMHYAVEWGHKRIISVLIKNGADVNALNIYKCSPLSYSMSTQVSRILINKGARINQRDMWNETYLHAAAENGIYSIVRLALQKGALIDAKNYQGDTPLHLAVHYASTSSHFRIIKELIKRGSDINVKNNYGWSPLHLAVQKGNIKITRFLIKKGANINGGTLKYHKKFNVREKSTALHIAVREFSSSLRIIKLLIKKGADLELKDKSGMTPLGLAMEELNKPDSEYYGTLKEKLRKRKGLKKVIELLKKIMTEKHKKVVLKSFYRYITFVR
ncbi:ankyrin repeat domain-containing protein, partial [Spirochaetota bacterium]